MATTVLSDLIDPEVMADSISADLPARIAAKGFMKVNTDLVAKPGDTITVPRFNYVGPAADLAEGVEGSVSTLTSNEASYTVKKAVKNIELTDEAILSGYGDPATETTKQLRMSIQDKIDNDAIDLLENDAGIYRFVSGTALNFTSIGEAMIQFADEEQGGTTYLLVSQEGFKQLKTDANYLDVQVLAEGVVRDGVLGKIAGAYVMITNKLNGTNDVRHAYLLKEKALTAFLKRDVNLETGRNVLSKKTLFSADEHYVVAIEDENKIVGITHTNAILGKLKVDFVTKKQSDGTYDVTINGIYPGKFSVNTVQYQLGASPVSVAYDGVLTTGWTSIAAFPVTIENVGATPIITVVQKLTADNKAKYYGATNLLK